MNRDDYLMLGKNYKMQIHCYKHNGMVHRIWKEATIIDETDDYLVCGNYKTKVIESDGRCHNTKEPAIIFFYKKSWFNVIAQFKDFGLFYYCNIASPYLIDKNIIRYIDYDLDLRVFPDGGYRILDRNEYKYHKKIMNYSCELDFILNKELAKLIKMKKEKVGPFDMKIINNYLLIYKKIRNIK